MWNPRYRVARSFALSLSDINMLLWSCGIQFNQPGLKTKHRINKQRNGLRGCRVISHWMKSFQSTTIRWKTGVVWTDDEWGGCVGWELHEPKSQDRTVHIQKDRAAHGQNHWSDKIRPRARFRPAFCGLVLFIIKLYVHDPPLSLSLSLSSSSLGSAS